MTLDEIKSAIGLTPYYEDSAGVIYCGDCMDILPKIPDKSIDLVLTDPPYNASGNNIHFKEKGYNSVDEDWDLEFALDMSRPWELLVETGSLVAFCSAHILADYLNWRTPRQILHWEKTNPFPALVKVYTPSVEYVLWYTKGSPYYFDKPFAGTDVFNSSICNGNERTEHPTQKPLSVISSLVKVHSSDTSIVLDPFLGSGTTAVAAKQLGRKYIGIEISEKYCEIAKQRLAQEELFGS